MTPNDRQDLIDGLTEIIDQYTAERALTSDPERLEAYDRLIASLQERVAMIQARQ